MQGARCALRVQRSISPEHQRTVEGDLSGPVLSGKLKFALVVDQLTY